MDKGYVNGVSTKQLIRDKMKVLDDFAICSRYDKTMIEKLKNAIAENPNKDPREALDYYCRPIIQAKVNSWVDA